MMEMPRVCSRLKLHVLSFLVAGALLLSGCAEMQQDHAMTQSESSASQGVSMSDSLPEEENAYQKDIPVHDEEFYEEVLLNFGAQWVPQSDGSSYMGPDMISFFYGHEEDDWKSPEEL